MKGPTDDNTVALYGGSFNPPHICHVLATAHILSTGKTQQVWWLPTFKHAFSKELAPFHLRCQMASQSLSIFDPGLVRVDPVEEEIGVGGRTTYTVDVLEVLVQRHPHKQFFLILGSDQLPDLRRWKQFDRVKALATPLFIGRLGHPAPQEVEVKVWLPDISSTTVRQQVAQGLDTTHLLPEGVERLIRRHHLYGA